MKIVKNNPWIVPLILIITLLLFVRIYFYIIPQNKNALFEANKRIIKEIVYSNISTLNHYHELEKKGILSRKVAQQRALEQIQFIRYGKSMREYLWINDMKPVMVMHPYTPELNGKYLGNYRDQKGNRLFQNAVELVRSKKEGFIRYWWQKHDNEKKIEAKISFVKGFKPWGWIIGTGIYLEDSYTSISSAVKTTHNLTYLSIFLLLLLTFILIHHLSISQKKEKDQNYMLTSIIDNIYQFTGLLSSDGRVLISNKYALDSIGESAKNILGRFFWDTPWWNHSIVHQENIKQGVARAGRGEIVRFEAKHPDKEGKMIYVDFTIKPIYDQNGIIRYLLSEGKNITEMKQMEHMIKGLDTETSFSDFGYIPPLDQLLNIEELQLLQDNFAKATGVASIIIDSDGNAITNPSNFSALCHSISEHSKNSQSPYFIEFQSKIKNDPGIIIQKHEIGGMWHAGTRITVSGANIGNWVIGQVRLKNISQERLKNIAQNSILEEDDFINKYNRIPIMPEEQFEHICQVVHLIANQLSNLAFKNILQAKQIIYRKEVEKKLQERKGELKSKLNSQSKNLEEINTKLLNTARLAGRAEFATGILHNVGNVLNSIGVGVYSQKKLLESSHVSNLKKVIELFNNNEKNLADFIENNPKGKKSFAFLKVISDELEKNQESMKEELKNIKTQVDHIKDIISVQQALGKLSSEKEIISINDMIQDAIKICQIDQSYISFEQSYEEEIEIDKIKTLQILINLISNANAAIMEVSDKQEKKITITTKQNSNSLLIEVTDTGIGMSDETQQNLFQHGFTTKKNGHGFGLHNSLKLAKDFGGNLTATSPGPRKGSTFSLYIPLGTSLKKIA